MKIPLPQYKRKMDWSPKRDAENEIEYVDGSDNLQADKFNQRYTHLNDYLKLLQYTAWLNSLSAGNNASVVKDEDLPHDLFGSNLLEYETDPASLKVTLKMTDTWVFLSKGINPIKPSVYFQEFFNGDVPLNWSEIGTPAGFVGIKNNYPTGGDEWLEVSQDGGQAEGEIIGAQFDYSSKGTPQDVSGLMVRFKDYKIAETNNRIKIICSGGNNLQLEFDNDINAFKLTGTSGAGAVNYTFTLTRAGFSTFYLYLRQNSTDGTLTVRLSNGTNYEDYSVINFTQTITQAQIFSYSTSTGGGIARVDVNYFNILYERSVTITGTYGDKGFYSVVYLTKDDILTFINFASGSYDIPPFQFSNSMLPLFSLPLMVAIISNDALNFSSSYTFDLRFWDAKLTRHEAFDKLMLGESLEMFTHSDFGHGIRKSIEISRNGSMKPISMESVIPDIPIAVSDPKAYDYTGILNQLSAYLDDYFPMGNTNEGYWNIWCDATDVLQLLSDLQIRYGSYGHITKNVGKCFKLNVYSTTPETVKCNIKYILPSSVTDFVLEFVCYAYSNNASGITITFFDSSLNQVGSPVVVDSSYYPTDVYYRPLNIKIKINGTTEQIIYYINNTVVLTESIAGFSDIAHFIIKEIPHSIGGDPAVIVIAGLSVGDLAENVNLPAPIMDMYGSRLTRLSAPVDMFDAVNKGYVNYEDAILDNKISVLDNRIDIIDNHSIYLPNNYSRSQLESAISTLNGLGGGTICLPPTTLTLTSTLTISANNITIIGSSDGNSKFYGEASALGGTALITITGSRIKLINIRFTINSLYTIDRIGFQGNECIAERCVFEFTTSKGTPIYLRDGIRNIINNCLFLNGGDDILIQLENTSYNIVSNNRYIQTITPFNSSRFLVTITASRNIVKSNIAILNGITTNVMYISAGFKNTIVDNIIQAPVSGVHSIQIFSGSNYNIICQNNMGNGSVGGINDLGTGNVKTDNIFDDT